jgi:hypothetical protein
LKKNSQKFPISLSKNGEISPKKKKKIEKKKKKSLNRIHRQNLMVPSSWMIQFSEENG